MMALGVAAWSYAESQWQLEEGPGVVGIYAHYGDPISNGKLKKYVITLVQDKVGNTNLYIH